jgi:ATP-binding cassette subfamily B protein
VTEGNRTRDGLGGGTRIARRLLGAVALTWRAGPVLTTVTLLLTTIQGLFPAATAWLTKLLLDALQSPDQARAHPLVLVLGIGIVGSCAAVAVHVMRYVNGQLGRATTVTSQRELYSAVNRFQGLARFESPAFLDRLRLAQQAAQMAPNQATSSIFSIGQSLVGIGGLLAVLMTVSPVMTVITVLAAVPALFVQIALSRREASVTWAISPRHRRQFLFQSLMLNLAAVKEIRLFHLGDLLLGRMLRETAGINEAERRMDLRTVVTQSPLALLGTAIAAGGLLWMVGRTMTGAFTIGDVSAFVAAVAGVQAALATAASATSDCYRALLLFGHYLDVRQMGSDLQPPRGALAQAPPLRQAVEIDNVWFRYTEDGPWVLCGTTFTIPHGTSAALVGLNGSGKSTLVKLLCRMYDPQRGAIRWDGVDLRDLDIEVLRERMSVVFQDYMSYDLTAAENIGIGDVRHLDDRERVVAAARQAGVDDTIGQLKRGYDTMLSRTFFQGDNGDGEERGVILSGGQWQRVAIARALMRADRDLLILDEPSSGLDPAAERAVHQRLRAYREGATSLLISHRLGAIKDADKIVVLQDGTVTEQGTHADLMAEGGEYSRLFRLQAENYVERSATAPPATMPTPPDLPGQLTPVPGAPARANIEGVQ